MRPCVVFVCKIKVDRTWQNPNRITAAQGRVVTVSAVRRHVV
jgi:hypothetical protein